MLIQMLLFVGMIHRISVCKQIKMEKYPGQRVRQGYYSVRAEMEADHHQKNKYDYEATMTFIVQNDGYRKPFSPFYPKPVAKPFIIRMNLFYR